MCATQFLWEIKIDKEREIEIDRENMEVNHKYFKQ